MAYGAVDRQTWNDERFRAWDRDVRDVWLYLLTCPHGNRLGCFVLSPLYVADDVQISPDRARECLEFLEGEERIVWDEERRVVCIVRHLHPDYNPLANQSVVKAAVKDLKDLPNSRRAMAALLWAVRKWGKPHYKQLEQRLEHCVPQGVVDGEPDSDSRCPAFTRVTPDPDPDPDHETEGAGSSLPSVETSPDASAESHEPDQEGGDADEPQLSAAETEQRSGSDEIDAGEGEVDPPGEFFETVRSHQWADEEPDGSWTGAGDAPWSMGREVSKAREIIEAYDVSWQEHVNRVRVIANRRELGQLNVLDPGEPFTGRLLRHADEKGQRLYRQAGHWVRKAKEKSAGRATEPDFLDQVPSGEGVPA